MQRRIPLLYALYTSSFYGTEQMALATAWGLRDEFEPIIIAPAGPAIVQARKMGFTTVEAASAAAHGGLRSVDFIGFAATIRPYLRTHETLAFISTHPGQSIVASALNLLYRRKLAHLHVMHGPPNVSRGIRNVFNALRMTIVAISEYSKQQLVSSGVRSAKIKVIDNFLTADRVAGAPRRGSFGRRSPNRVAIASRIVPAKRIDVLLSCLEARRDFDGIEFIIYGTGVDGNSYADELRSRAEKNKLNIVFEGFRSDLPAELAKADLLLHLCSTEPFGLVILEAMAAGIPALVPDRGGAACIVEDGVSGFVFRADDHLQLGERLDRVLSADAALLNAVVDNGRVALETRFSERHGIASYRELLHRHLKMPEETSGGKRS